MAYNGGLPPQQSTHIDQTKNERFRTRSKSVHGRALCEENSNNAEIHNLRSQLLEAEGKITEIE